MTNGTMFIVLVWYRLLFKMPLLIWSANIGLVLSRKRLMRLIFMAIDTAAELTVRSNGRCLNFVFVFFFCFNSFLAIVTVCRVRLCWFQFSSMFDLVPFLASFMCANCIFHCMLSAFCFIFYLLININETKRQTNIEIVICGAICVNRKWNWWEPMVALNDTQNAIHHQHSTDRERKRKKRIWIRYRNQNETETWTNERWIIIFIIERQPIHSIRNDQ